MNKTLKMVCLLIKLYELSALSSIYFLISMPEESEYISGFLTVKITTLMEVLKSDIRYYKESKFISLEEAAALSTLLVNLENEWLDMELNLGNT